MRLPIAFSLGLLAGACGSSATAPSTPAQSRMVFTSTMPPSGSTVVVPADIPSNSLGGVVIPRSSGLVSVGLSMTSAHDVPFARLNVYLLTGGTTSEYCGINDPDAPTWQFLTPGWTTGYTVTGFSVYRLPCDVTGIRAMLHMRNNGLFAPPTPTETVVEATAPVSFQLRRQAVADR
jgi:hypothetical protein